MIIMVILFLVLLFNNVQLRHDNEYDIFSVETSQSLRGFSAIEIMFGHIGIATQNVLLFANRKAGILFVGIFFMLSGYGLIYSLQNKENYINYFLRKRFLKIFIPAYIVYLIIVFINLSRFQIPFEVVEILKYVIGYHFAGMNWYVVELIGIYIIFQIIYKYISIHYANLIFLVISMLFTVIAFFIDLDNPWYGSTLCFNIGLFYGEYKENINRYFQRKFWIKNITCICILLLGILGFFLWDNTFLGNVLFRNLASIFWVFWLISILQKVNFSSKLCGFLGEFSYEIYLIHPVVILLLSNFIHPLIFSILCIVITIAVAWMFHKLLKIIL